MKRYLLPLLFLPSLTLAQVPTNPYSCADFILAKGLTCTEVVDWTGGVSNPLSNVPPYPTLGPERTFFYGQTLPDGVACGTSSNYIFLRTWVMWLDPGAGQPRRSVAVLNEKCESSDPIRWDGLIHRGQLFDPFKGELYVALFVTRLNSLQSTWVVRISGFKARDSEEVHVFGGSHPTPAKR